MTEVQASSTPTGKTRIETFDSYEHGLMWAAVNSYSFMIRENERREFWKLNALGVWIRTTKIKGG